MLYSKKVGKSYWISYTSKKSKEVKSSEYKKLVVVDLVVTSKKSQNLLKKSYQWGAFQQKTVPKHALKGALHSKCGANPLLLSFKFEMLSKI
jgi:hypothetical protein